MNPSTTVVRGRVRARRQALLVAMLVFAAANSVGWLFAGRAIQGLATGAVLSAVARARGRESRPEPGRWRTPAAAAW